MLAKIKARLNQKALRAFDTNRKRKYSMKPFFRHNFFNDGLGQRADEFENYYNRGKMSRVEFLAKYWMLADKDMEHQNHDGNMGTL